MNFLNGQSVDGDIALHLNPRVQTREMVLNSRIGGTWQEEEKVTLPGEFSYGKPFQIKVEAKKKKFKVRMHQVEHNNLVLYTCHCQPYLLSIPIRRNCKLELFT